MKGFFLINILNTVTSPTYNRYSNLASIKKLDFNTMRNVILFDDDNWNGLLPLSFTRPVCEIRVGILTIREKWEKVLDARCSYITQDFLSEKYAIHIA